MSLCVSKGKQLTGKVVLVFKNAVLVFLQIFTAISSKYNVFILKKTPAKYDIRIKFCVTFNCHRVDHWRWV